MYFLTDSTLFFLSPLPSIFLLIMIVIATVVVVVVEFSPLFLFLVLSLTFKDSYHGSFGVVCVVHLLFLVLLDYLYLCFCVVEWFR